MSHPAELARAAAEPGPPAPFVVGVARSGTTLLRMMLDAHPALAIPPETHFVPRTIDMMRRPAAGASDGRDAAARLERAVAEIVRRAQWPDLGIPAAELAAVADSAPRATAGQLVRAVFLIYARRAGKPRWGDKTPPYLERMADIHAELPEARFVHVVRDGRDVALSAIPLWFGPTDVVDAARQWSSRIAAAREQARDLPYLELRYEDLVRDPAGELRRLCAFLDLRWDATMLDYHERAPGRLAEIRRDLPWPDGRTIPAGKRIAIHERAAEPPSPNRIERWRDHMSPSDRRAFERIAGDTLEQLGYTT